MLPVTTVSRIVRLLNQGNLSQRQIAARLRVSRTVVAAVVAGRRGELSPKQRAEIIASHPPGPRPQRCPGCGGLVFPPCRLCLARRHAQDEDPPRKAA